MFALLNDCGGVCTVTGPHFTMKLSNPLKWRTPRWSKHNTPNQFHPPSGGVLSPLHKTALKMHHPLPVLPSPPSCSSEIDIRVTVPLNYHIVPNFSSIVSHYGGPGEVRSVPYRFKIDANSLEAASLGPTPPLPSLGTWTRTPHTCAPGQQYCLVSISLI